MEAEKTNSDSLYCKKQQLYFYAKINSKLLYPLAGLATLASCGGGEKAELAKPLNIVYIMTDDHTRQMMSSYDNRHIETPNLDRIAEGGVLFENAFVCNSISGS